MTGAPLAAVAAVCGGVVALVASVAYRRRVGAAGRSTPAGAGRQRQVLAVATAVLVLCSSLTAPVAASLGTGAGAPSVGADGDVDARSSGGPGTTAGTETEPASVGSAPATTASSSGGTESGNTGFQPWYYYADGVNLASGNLYRSATDLSVPARGPTLEFVRSYNSDLSHEHGALGFGWTHNYAMRLEERSDGSVVFVAADGARHRFTPSDSGYEAPAGVDARLDARSNGYVLRRLDGTVLRFDDAGVLQWIEDRNGNRNTLEYADGRLTAVRGESGVALTFEYDGDGHIVAVSDPLNRTVEFEYAVGDLVSATSKTGATTEYRYYENHKMRQTVNPDGIRTIYRYDRETDRVVFFGNGETVDACQRTGVSVHYDDVNRTATLFNRDSGNATTVTMNAAGSPTNITGERGPVEMSWDDDRNLLAETNETGTYSFAYDEYGNRISWTGPNGRTVTTTWETTDTADAYFSVVGERTDARGRTTTYRYDDDGNRIETVGPNGKTVERSHDEHGNVRSRTDTLGRVTNFTYNDQGLRTSVVRPDGSTQNYTYDAGGATHLRDGRTGQHLLVQLHRARQDRPDRRPARERTRLRLRRGRNPPPDRPVGR